MNITTNSPDLLAAVCSKLPTVQDLARFAQCNKAVCNYLMRSAGEQHWLDVGRETVGDEYWVQPVEDGMYHLKIQMCPWMSAQSVIKIQPIDLARKLQQKPLPQVKAIRIRDQDDYKMICIKILVDPANDGDKVCFHEMSDREEGIPHNAYQPIDYPDTTVKFPANYNLKQDRDREMNIILDETRWAKRMCLEIAAVLKVHKGIFAVLMKQEPEDDSDEDRDDEDMFIKYSHTTIHFVAYNTHRILYSIHTNCSTKSVAFAPGGRMYIASFTQLICSGPRTDKGLRYLHRIPATHGAQIYLDAISGDVRRAVGSVVALGLDLDVMAPVIAECAVLGTAEPTALLETLYDLYPGFACINALRTAIEINSVHMVKFLLAKGVDPSSCPTILSYTLGKARHYVETNTFIQLCTPRQYKRSDDPKRRSQIVELLSDVKAVPNE